MAKTNDTQATPTPLADLERQRAHWQTKGAEYQGTIDTARATVNRILAGRTALLLRADHGDEAAQMELNRSNVELRDAEQALDDAHQMTVAAAEELHRLDVALAAERKNEVRRLNREDDEVRIAVAAEMETVLAQLMALFATYKAAVGRQESRSIAAKLPEPEIQAVRTHRAISHAIGERTRHMTGSPRAIQPHFAVGTLDEIERERASRRLVGTDATPAPSDAAAAIDATMIWGDADPHRTANETTH